MSRRLNSRETKRTIRSLGIDSAAASTFGVFDDARNIRYEFHRHRRHQLTFPTAGLLFVETGDTLHACSPQSGLWIPAGVRHATTTGTHATVSVFFEPTKFSRQRTDATMVTITPLLHECAGRAGLGERLSINITDALFRVIYEEMAANFVDSLWPSLPVAKSAIMQRTVDLAFQSLSSITVARLAKKSGQSDRSMRRRFVEEMGMGPEFFIQRARLIRGMHLLIESQKRPITEIAMEVGYANHSAFTSAFHRLTGYTPKTFRAISLRAVQ